MSLTEMESGQHAVIFMLETSFVQATSLSLAELKSRRFSLQIEAKLQSEFSVPLQKLALKQLQSTQNKMQILCTGRRLMKHTLLARECHQ